MRSSKSYVFGFLSGSLAAAACLAALLTFPGHAGGQATVGGLRGAGEAGMVEETVRWKLQKGPDREQRIQRALIKVPQAYGTLTEITGGSQDPVLWFVDQKGVVRNVVLGPTLVRVQIE